jgi:uncharacterized membrane protein
MTWPRGVILVAGVSAFATVFSGFDPNYIEFWRVALCTFIAFVSITLWNYQAVRNDPALVLRYLLFTLGFAVLLWMRQVLDLRHHWS